MANNLKKFASEAAYTSASLVRPAVSLIEANNNVHFDPSAPWPALNGFDIAVEYEITDYTQEAKIYNGAYGEYQPIDVTEMEVDGVSVTPSNTYRFSSNGKHIVKYKVGNGEIYPSAFSTTQQIKPYSYIVIGSGITKVGEGSLSNGTGVIKSYVFEGTTPPEELSGATLGTIANVYVPASAVNTFKTALQGSDFENLVQANPYE